MAMHAILNYNALRRDTVVMNTTTPSWVYERRNLSWSLKYLDKVVKRLSD